VHIAIIGHLTRDITDDGYDIGGAVSYSGVTARRLGADVTVLTRAHLDDVRILEDEGIQVINLPTDVYTTFLNVYYKEIRTQQLLSVAGPILASETPPEIFDADVLLLAPVAQEVDPAIAQYAKNKLAATPQGWMREWDSSGRVFAIPWYSSGRILPYLDSIVFSDLDLIGDLSILPVIIDTVPLVAITKADKGCVLYHRGQRRQIHTRPAREVDTTGAGDTFTAAFLIEVFSGKSPIEAAYFANVTASLSIEGVGLSGIPHRQEVEATIQAHPGP
jgi:sugar/nucleoside kinase (ribokinase family)